MKLAKYIVGQAILPAAAFQAALSAQERRLKERRLKAGGSQDWLPHFRSRSYFRSRSK